MLPVHKLHQVPKKPHGIVQGLRGVAACAQDFCRSTSMHGFCHITAPNRSWLERVLWACATAAAIWGAVNISLGQWQRYNENPTVVALEKDFRSWEFCFPGITICPENRVDAVKVQSVIKQHWNVEPQNEKYEYYKHFVTTVANSNKFTLENLAQFEGEELDVDLYQLVIDVMPEMDMKVTWSATREDVKWFLIMSEAGLCYSTNTVALANDAITKPNTSQTAIFPLTCKYSSLSCYLHVEFHSATNIYVHSPYDIMDVNSGPHRVDTGVDRTIELSVSESRCGRGVRELDPRRRRCLYTDEPAEGRQVYSTNTCRRSCRNQLAVQEYGCKPFYNHFEEGATCPLARTRPSHSAPAPICVCTAMCVDAVYRQLSNVSNYLGSGPFMKQGVFRVKVQAPRTRYTREIVFHFQDLVVSFGGAAGLFLGASFISFVEILYFALERTLAVFAVHHDDTQAVQAKKATKVPYEQARIMELTAILEGRRFQPGWEPARRPYQLY